MNKIKPIFLFIVKNETNNTAAKIIKTQLTLNKYIQLYPQHEVKDFTNVEEAQSFINMNNFLSIDAKMVKDYATTAAAAAAAAEEPKVASNTATVKTSIEKPKKTLKPQDDPLEFMDSQADNSSTHPAY
jgi:hypothetical protein